MVPAKQEELAEVAKAMHREKSGAQVNHLFQWEKNAALSAIQTGEPSSFSEPVTGPWPSSNRIWEPYYSRVVALWTWQYLLPETWGASKWAKVDAWMQGKSEDIHIKSR